MTPMFSAAELEAMGFALVIFPAGVVRTQALAARDYYAELMAKGSSEGMRGRMLDFDGLNELIGTPEMLALGKTYE
jgi:2-methylisocitrate lyase-like PEP mutase family enzyme